MDKIFTVEWCEMKTTSTGKDKKDCTLKDDLGFETSGVTIWGDFPGFAEIMPGSKVTGTLTPSKNPSYGPTLYAPRTPKTASGGGFKAQVIEKAMDKKNESISKFQASKEDSIKLASAQRDSVLIVTTFYKQISEDKAIGEAEKESILKKKIVDWRDWFLTNKDFNEGIPF